MAHSRRLTQFYVQAGLAPRYQVRARACPRARVCAPWEVHARSRCPAPACWALSPLCAPLPLPRRRFSRTRTTSRTSSPILTATATLTAATAATVVTSAASPLAGGWPQVGCSAAVLGTSKLVHRRPSSAPLVPYATQTQAARPLWAVRCCAWTGLGRGADAAVVACARGGAWAAADGRWAHGPRAYLQRMAVGHVPSTY